MKWVIQNYMIVEIKYGFGINNLTNNDLYVNIVKNNSMERVLYYGMDLQRGLF